MKWLRLSGIFAVAVLLLSISSIRAWAVTHYVRIPGKSPYYDSIQAAINAASYGDTILVGAGEYYEQITVEKDGLTIRSQSGPGQTIIRAPELFPAAVTIKGNDNKFRGFTVVDSTTGHSHTHRLIFVQGDRNTISNNILIGRGEVSPVDVGILVRGEENVGDEIAEGNIISSNEVYNVRHTQGNATGILSVSVIRNGKTLAARGTQIRSNIVHDCSQGIYIDRSPSCIVRGNIVYDNDLGIGVRSRLTTEGLSSTGTQVFGNIVSYNTVGARFVACSNVTVGRSTNPNDFTDNVVGILVEWDDRGNTGAPTIRYNNIEGNVIGLQNEANQTVNARNNWWGDPNGPSVPSNMNPTNGDTIEGTYWNRVLYSPWATAPL
jgi:parallel beta-helix repeat protein